MGFTFVLGQEVEVRSNERGFKGSWYEAKVVATPVKVTELDTDMYEIEYVSLLDLEKASKLLREGFVGSDLRPKPPEIGKEKFVIGEVVDVYHNDGWWKGVVSRFMKNGYLGVVLEISGEEEDLDFGMWEMRVHLEWVDGKWFDANGKIMYLACEHRVLQRLLPHSLKVSPLTTYLILQLIHSREPSLSGSDQIVLTGKTYSVNNFFLHENLKTKKRSNRRAKVRVQDSSTSKDHMLPVGSSVEVCLDDEELKGVWVPATILDAENNYYRIEYRNSELHGELKEEVDAQNVQDVLRKEFVRPVPPNNLNDQTFNISQEVEVFADYGWWTAVITGILPDKKYAIFSYHEMPKKVFHQSQLRSHMEWMDGDWTKSSNVAGAPEMPK